MFSVVAKTKRFKVVKACIGEKGEADRLALMFWESVCSCCALPVSLFVT